MLNNGKNAWVNAMIDADKAFAASYGANLGENDPDVLARLQDKYEAQFDALVSLFTGYAEVMPGNLNVSAVTGIANLSTGAVVMVPPAMVSGTGVIQ